jgi:serine/threonine protein kinase
VGKHPNVVELLGVFETPTSVQLVFELMAGELFERLVNQGPFTEEQASKTARKLTNVLQHLHTNNICHRDVKPENLLLTSKEANAEVKLCDFGLACIINPERQNMKTVCGYVCMPQNAQPALLAAVHFLCAALGRTVHLRSALPGRRTLIRWIYGA